MRMVSIRAPCECSDFGNRRSGLHYGGTSDTERNQENRDDSFSESPYLRGEMLELLFEDAVVELLALPIGGGLDEG